MNVDPLYPFGFGLSYTSFCYGEAKTASKIISKKENISISVTITNTGKVKSDEVIQLYVTDLIASVTVPNYQLAKMNRISLEAGESKEVTFELTPKAFEMVKENGSRTIESGEFKIYIGGSSPMKRSFELGASKMSELILTLK